MVLEVPESGIAAQSIELFSSESVMFIFGVCTLGQFFDSSHALMVLAVALVISPSSSEVAGEAAGVFLYFIEPDGWLPLKHTVLKCPFRPQFLQVASRALHWSL